MDQAASLRKAVDNGVPREGGAVKAARVLAVSSGKGGVGKTNSVVNLAAAFAAMRKKVLILDADLGLGNIDVLLGISPKYNIGHLLRGEKTLDEVIVEGPAGIMILPASSGVQELTNLAPQERLSLQSHLDRLATEIDIMMIDTGAGISSNVLFFNVSADDIIVVVSPEPTSLTDAYALMKVLLKRHGERRFKLIVNSVKTRKEGLDVFRKISLAAERFLDISIDYLGCVFHDENVQRAVVRQRPVFELYPDTKASLCFREIAGEICAMPAPCVKGGMQFFWRQMLGRGD